MIIPMMDICLRMTFQIGDIFNSKVQLRKKAT